MWLVKNGVPYDVAFAMEPEERAAHAIVFAGFEGNEFDWAMWQFKERG